MLHYVFILCILALLLPSFTAIPMVPGYALFFISGALVSLFVNSLATIKSSASMVFVVLLVHLIYSSLDLYHEDSSRALSDFVMPIIVSNVFLSYYKTRLSKFSSFMKIFLVALFITSLTTTAALQVFPEASRLLAGSLAAQERLEEARFYKLLGIGDYVIVVFWVFVSLVLFYLMRQGRHTWISKYFIVLFIIGYAIALIESSYTTPLLILIFGLVMMRFRNYFVSVRRSLALIIVSYGVFVLTGNLLSSMLYWLADILNSPFISPRLENIAMRLDGTITETGFEVARGNKLIDENAYLGAYEQRASMSWNAFIQNPLTGGGEVGGHNFFIDILGMYGVVGALLVGYLLYKFFAQALNVISSFQGKIIYKYLFVLFLTLGIVKTYILLPFFLIFFFVMPLFINIVTLDQFDLLKKKLDFDYHTNR